MKDSTLYSLNRKLIEYTQQLSDTYFEVRERGEAKDFFREVKPFCDRVKAVCDEWLPLAGEWVTDRRPKHLHAVQLQHTAENLQMVSVRAFYPESSRKQMINHIHSIDYVLRQLEEELQNE